MIEPILNVGHPTGNHLYRTQPDIDLAVESLREPGALPLIFKAGA